MDYDALTNGKFHSFSVSASDGGASEASEKISDFFKENDPDSPLGFTLPMALEEILVIFNRYALADNTDAYEDVRIYVDRGGALLRIRCDGNMFDPIEWYKEKTSNMTPEELLDDDSLGMKMIVKKAKKITYQRTFGANNLVILL